MTIRNFTWKVLSLALLILEAALNIPYVTASSTQSHLNATSSTKRPTSSGYKAPSFGSAVWLIVLLIALACVTVLLITLVFAVVIYRYRTRIAKEERDDDTSRSRRKRKLFRTSSSHI